MLEPYPLEEKVYPRGCERRRENKAYAINFNNVSGYDCVISDTLSLQEDMKRAIVIA